MNDYLKLLVRTFIGYFLPCAILHSSIEVLCNDYVLKTYFPIFVFYFLLLSLIVVRVFLYIWHFSYFYKYLVEKRKVVDSRSREIALFVFFLIPFAFEVVAIFIPIIRKTKFILIPLSLALGFFLCLMYLSYLVRPGKNILLSLFVSKGQVLEISENTEFKNLYKPMKSQYLGQKIIMRWPYYYIVNTRYGISNFFNGRLKEKYKFVGGPVYCSYDCYFPQLQLKRNESGTVLTVVDSYFVYYKRFSELRVKKMLILQDADNEKVEIEEYNFRDLVASNQKAETKYYFLDSDYFTNYEKNKFLKLKVCTDHSVQRMKESFNNFKEFFVLNFDLKATASGDCLILDFNSKDSLYLFDYFFYKHSYTVVAIN